MNGRCIRRAGPKHDPDRGLCATDFAYHSRDAPEPRPTSIGVARSVAATRSREPRLIRGFDGKPMGVVPGPQ